jgi:hypothetical protein
MILKFFLMLTCPPKPLAKADAHARVEDSPWRVRARNLKQTPSNETHLTTVTEMREICRRMSRFRARRCIKQYKIILFRRKKTPAGGKHPGRPGNFHPNICANHYHL